MTVATDHSIVRTKISKTYDDGEEQRFEASGRKNEKYGGTKKENATPRVQSYGFSSHVPAGSIAITQTPQGNPENAMIIGAEHPEHRPKNLGEGEWKQYDMWGGFMHATADGWHLIVGAVDIWFKQNGDVHIKGAKIILEPTDKVYLGGPDADKEASMKGTIDTALAADIDNLATKVMVK